MKFFENIEGKGELAHSGNHIKKPFSILPQLELNFLNLIQSETCNL